MTDIFIRFGRKFSKRTQQWCHVRVLELKQCTYIPELMLKKRINSAGPIDQRIG